MSSSHKISPISPPMELGEGPHWIKEDDSLLFVDYPAGKLNRLYTNTGRHQVMDLEGAGNGVGPSVIIPVEGHDDKYLVGLGHDLVCVKWSPTDPDHVERKPVNFLSFDQHHPKNGLNDAKCDPQGRLWAGTKGDEATPGVIDPKKGTLYKIDHDFNASAKVKEVTISNGLTWSLDAKTFYYIDTLAFSVDAFDYDDLNGDISNRRVVLDFKAAGLTDQGPDGMTIDNDGNLWVACYDGAKVICVDPRVGKLLRKVDIPSRYTTSCCFGGPDYATLFVTSATRGMTERELQAEPHSGKTFAVTGLGAKGSPHQIFKPNPKIFNEKFVNKMEQRKSNC